MKYNKFIFIFVMCIISLLSGCGNVSEEANNNVFVEYEIKSNLPKIEYKIYNATEPIIIYFPVVTSEKITETKLGGVAAKLPPTKKDIKVSLHSMKQDKLNFLLQDKYVSFLKYQLDIENMNLLKANDIINLCDTTIWIYHNSEYQKIQIDKDYLQLTIVENENEVFLPDWENIVFNMKKDIGNEFKNGES